MAAKFKQEGVVPLLVDASNGDLSDSPLKHFNSVELEKEKILGIHRMINKRMAQDDADNLEGPKLDEYFESNWPVFKTAIDAISVSESPREPDTLPTENFNKDETLDEILGLVRKIDRSTRNSVGGIHPRAKLGITDVEANVLEFLRNHSVEEALKTFPNLTEGDMASLAQNTLGDKKLSSKVLDAMLQKDLKKR